MGRKTKQSLITIIFLTTLFVLFGFTLSFATEITVATGKIDSSNGVVVRSDPSTEAKKVTVLDNDTDVIIYKEYFVTDSNTDKENIWLYVKSGSKKGYVRSDLVNDIKYSVTDAKTTSKVSYRSGPGTKMAKEGSLKKDKAIEIVLKANNKNNSKDWYKIKKGSNYYYLSSSWAKLSKAATKVTMIEPTTPERLPDGTTFNISGLILSNYSTNRVKAGIIDGSGKWVYMSNPKVGSSAFDLSEISSALKFDKLPIGTYSYKVVVNTNGKNYTKINKIFKVVKAANAEKITNKAFELAWPMGTDSSKYAYPGGSPTKAYKKALDDVYPNRGKWGGPPKAGASCDVFVGTVLRASGVDKDAPRGGAEQYKYFPSSPKYKKVDYKGDQKILKSGDIIFFKRKGSSGAHVCIYLVKDGTKYIAEANYNKTYGMLTKSTSAINSKLRTTDKVILDIYRIVEN